MCEGDRQQRTRAVEAGGRCEPHPAGDSSGKPKYALRESTFKSSLTHCDSVPSLVGFFPSTLQSSYVRVGLKNIPSVVKEQHNTVLFPLWHMITGWKSTATDLLLTHFIRQWCMFVHASFSGRVAEEGGKGGITEASTSGQVRTWDIPRTYNEVWPFVDS